MLILLCQRQGALHESGPFWGIVRRRGAKAAYRRGPFSSWTDVTILNLEFGTENAPIRAP